MDQTGHVLVIKCIKEVNQETIRTLQLTAARPILQRCSEVTFQEVFAMNN